MANAMNRKDIMCRRCGIRVMSYDGKSKTPIITKCTGCGRYLRFNPLSQVTIFVEKPERQSSSGMRFY